MFAWEDSWWRPSEGPVLQVEDHLDHFAGDCPDVDWLPVVGERGWVVFSKDKMYRHDSVELKAIIEFKIKIFILTTKNCTGKDFADIFLSHLLDIGRTLKNNPPPFIARVSRNSIALRKIDKESE